MAWGTPAFRSPSCSIATSRKKFSSDQIRAAKEDVTLVALGPLTNIDRALQRDPELAGLLGKW